MVNDWLQQYGKSLGFSLFIHVVLLSFILLSVENTFNASALPAKQEGDIVQAVVVDEKKVTEEVQRLQNEAMEHKIQEEQQQKQLAQKVEQVKKEQEQEKAKLEQLKRDMAKAKQEEQDRLAEIKIAKEKERKQLEALKSEKASEQKRLAALDTQRQEREKEEKKRAQLAKQQADTKRKAEEAKQLAAQNAAKEAQRVAAENQRASSELQRIVAIWKDKIRSNKRIATGMAPDLTCAIAIKIFPDGTVNARLTQSSGNPAYDDLMIKAIYKSQPYELSEDPVVKEQLKDVEIRFTNEEGAGV
jgi:colicin import membrane protein